VVLKLFERNPKSGLNKKLTTLRSLKKSSVSKSIFVTTKNQPIFISSQPANITNFQGTQISGTAMSFVQCMPHNACA